ncbi:MAG: aminotransferase class I/II-fold pyridoxal phosphate-dependent enzyme [Eubacteriales bacterium]|nr:aminotransferase class I/II-fold pyridoxal phosphate-dependent enzyme [Eubacteriales bacterium]
MKYDFTSIMDRRGFDALAVEAVGKPGGFAPEAPAEGFDVIPMWVADMNFPTAPGIIRAIMDRAAHPAFGYFEPREDYYDAIIRWHRERHGIGAEAEHFHAGVGQAEKGFRAERGAAELPLTRECIGYENGVLGGVVSALNVFCSRGDHVLVHSPTYIGFTGTLRNNGYHIVHSPLIYEKNSSGKDSWRMDFEDMERKIRDGHIHAAVFCSPHNPCGRVWTLEELEQAYAIFEKYDVKVISDEIWSDLILPGYRHIPSQSVSAYARENTVALYAPSKTFNLAGLVGSYHIIYNRTLRERIRKESSLCHYNEMNVLSMHALLGAYTPGGMEWVDELCAVLDGNVRYAAAYIREHFDGVSLADPEGTYMLFADCTGWCEKHGKSLRELEQLCWRAGVALQDGKMFHGPCHLRINLALPRARVQEAMERLDRYVFNAT